MREATTNARHEAVKSQQKQYKLTRAHTHVHAHLHLHVHMCTVCTYVDMYVYNMSSPSLHSIHIQSTHAQEVG